MNKAELAAKIADRLGVPKKQGEEFVEAYQKIVTETLVNAGEVTIAGFGTFSARKRAGRMGVNPQNPTEKIQIPPVTVPKFKAGKALKDALKKKDKEKKEADEAPSAAPAPAAPAAPTDDQSSDDTTASSI